MTKLNEKLIADLKAVAEKHGITYETLCYRIRDMYDSEDHIEDIRTILVDEYPEIALTDKNVEIIYNRFIKAESSECGLWDNIRNAIDWVEDELELIEEDK